MVYFSIKSLVSLFWFLKLDDANCFKKINCLKPAKKEMSSNYKTFILSVRQIYFIFF